MLSTFFKQPHIQTAPHAHAAAFALRKSFSTCESRAPARIQGTDLRSHRAQAFDVARNITAYEFTSKGFSRIDVDTNGGKPHHVLAGHTIGVELHSCDGSGVPAESYQFAFIIGDKAKSPSLAGATAFPAVEDARWLNMR